MTDIMTDLNFNFSISDDLESGNEAFKFDLFLMTREIHQITTFLKHIALLPQKQQRVWVNDNQQLLQQFMHNLSYEMSTVLENMSLDRDVLHETISCVAELRELVHTLNGLMSESSSSLVS